MKLRLLVVVAVLCAMPAAALELRATVYPPLVLGAERCGTVVVNPSYTGTDPCVVAAVPVETYRLTWQATELWEMPPAGTPAGWTRLTCGATYDYGAQKWSFSCFNSGVIGEQNGTRMAGLFTGGAAQLDTTVRAWWQAQR